MASRSGRQEWWKPRAHPRCISRTANSLALLTSSSSLHLRTTYRSSCPRALRTVTWPLFLKASWGPAFQSQSSGPQSARQSQEIMESSGNYPHITESHKQDEGWRKNGTTTRGLLSAHVAVPLEGDSSTSPHSGIFMAQCTLTDQEKKVRGGWAYPYSGYSWGPLSVTRTMASEPSLP